MLNTVQRRTGEHRLVPALAAWRRFDWSLIAMILAIKGLILAFGAMSHQVLVDRRLAGLYDWLTIWDRWDGSHYLDLARYGYRATGELGLFLVFYPLYPWLARLFGSLNGDYLVGAFLVSGIASVAAAILLLQVVKLDYPERLAQRSVWFLFIFPTSYFLHIGYTESLFLALTLGCFWAARSQRWLLVGPLGMLAGLTRINGLILVPALLVEALDQYRSTQRWDWRWLAIGGVAIGVGAYLLLNLYVTGNPFTFLTLQDQHWHRSLAWPWIGITGTVRSIVWRTPAEAHMVGVQELIFVVLSLAATIWCCFRLRPSYSIWMAGNWLLFTSTAFVLSAPRYTLILFPMYILFAKLADHWLWNALITTWSLLFLALFISLFVQGRWAF